MKRALLYFALLLSSSMLWAQESMVREDLEILVDSLDQEQQPRRFSGGLLLGGNTSNFIIRKNSELSSQLRVGAQMGGLLDFYIFPHFAIQCQMIFTAEQNVLKARHESADHLWSFGMTLPVYFLWRHRDAEKGMVSLGGGPFTHFTFASNVGNYTNALMPMHSDSGEEYFHANHSGLGAMASYEFPIGILIQAGYQISLSDIFSYINNTPEEERQDTKIYPQRFTLSLGYRFKSSCKKHPAIPQYPIIIE